ncbi:MAG: hypothetical protein HUU47_11295 [Bacteroidetes bacterium]|nr:hypothetical protein [Bacteroidota bacterium]
MKKLITILMFLAFLTFSKNVVAQCFSYTCNNNTGCEWNIEFYDGMNIGIAAASYFSTGGSVTVPATGCLGCGNPNTNNGKFVFTNNGCSYTINLPSGGSITPTGCTLFCSGGGTTTSITVTVISGGATCTNEYIIDIN